jgi:hypothetical protein
MSANVENSETQIVVCSNCQTKNRVPSVAVAYRAAESATSRCGGW